MGDTWASRAELAGREGLALLFLVHEAEEDAEEERRAGEDARLKSNNPKQVVGEKQISFFCQNVFHKKKIS